MAALVLVGGTLAAGASSASANKVWYQSVGKASAEAPCPTSTGAELAAGWTQWSSSWAMWANQGRGGFVCNREITWAYSETTPTPAPSFPGCVVLSPQVGETVGTYFQFGNSPYIPADSPNSVFFTPDCSGTGVASTSPWAYALNLEEAGALCAPLGAIAATDELATADPNLYACFPI
jgi:hypothetical protein